jgi:RNA polymerase sigma factor (sigma-70 family)
VRGRDDSEALLRSAAPQALAVVTRRFGDFAGAEDAMQEAMLEASSQWQVQGPPENPVGWLIHVSSRRLSDRLRSESARRHREEAAVAQEPPPAEAGSAEAVADGDDSLALIFMCCHPALSPASAIALTLRAVGGLSTAEIAVAFLVPEATMAQRISRAKQTIKSTGARFEMPVGEEREQRLRAVLRVLYLVFNEGYLSSGGNELVRTELSSEAIRLTRSLHAALADDPEVTGLLALMLLTEARRDARSGANGSLIPLAEQDRSRWDAELIVEGVALIGSAWARRAIGEYQLQAAITATHDQAPSHEQTDWREILALYGLLERVSPSPMVSLNRAIAAAMVDGPEAGLALLEPLRDSLGDHHRLLAARAHLLEMNGSRDAAADEYATAARLTNSLPERHYLQTRAARLREAAEEVS